MRYNNESIPGNVHGVDEGFYGWQPIGHHPVHAQAFYLVKELTVSRVRRHGASYTQGDIAASALMQLRTRADVIPPLVGGACLTGACVAE